MEKFSRLILIMVLAIGVLGVAGSPADAIRAQKSFVPPKQPIAFPASPAYHDLWYSVNEWLEWLAATVPSVLQREWGSFTMGIQNFEVVPSVYALGAVRVQGNARGTSQSSSSVLVTLSSAPTNGNMLVATITLFANSISVTGISETGATWRLAKAATNAGQSERVEIWYAFNISGASVSITASFNTGAIQAAINVCEYSGIGSSDPLDQTASNTGGSSMTDTGTTPTTSQASELFIGGITSAGSQSTPTNGFTLLDGAVVSSISDAYLEKIVSATGTAHSGTTATSSAWAGAIATFKATAGPPPADFSITANPTSQSVGASATASSTLTVTAGGGFSGTVNLSVASGCPSSVTCSLSSTSINTSGTSTLTVPTLITTSGIFPVVVSATSGALNHSVTFTVTVTSPASYNFNVPSTATQIIVTVMWVGTGTASVTIAGPGASPTLSESGAVVYDRTSFISGVSPPTNIHRVTFTLSSPSAGTWIAYVSQSGATVTIEVS